MMNIRLSVLLLLIFAAAMYRLVPHVPNVSPLAAMALFGGVYFADRRLAFAVPFGALLLSDLVIGLHASLPFVYLAFAAMVLMGIWLNARLNLVNLAGATLASSVLFYLVTNFGSWLSHDMYPLTMEGLMQSYAAGIPFFRNTVLGDVFFVAIMFGGYALLKKNITALATD